VPQARPPTKHRYSTSEEAIERLELGTERKKRLKIFSAMNAMGYI
jgi:hypothetical protein